VLCRALEGVDAAAASVGPPGILPPGRAAFCRNAADVYWPGGDAMMTLELTTEETLLLRDVLVAHRHALIHEIHHADDRAFRQLLRQQSEVLDRLLQRLPAPEAVAGS
jgi:hypothetical protein